MFGQRLVPIGAEHCVHLYSEWSCMLVQIDCIPPHIDHHDFSRPFCTISLLSEQEIMFGHKLVPLSAGHFVGATCDSFMLPLPVGALTGHMLCTCVSLMLHMAGCCP